jgi:hypothetical protein
MQVSIHSLGSDVLLQEVRRAFPDSPKLAPLLAVVTMQFCGAARQLMLQKLQQQQQQDMLQAQAQQRQVMAAPSLPAAASCSTSHVLDKLTGTSAWAAADCAGDGCGGRHDGNSSSSSSSCLCSAADMDAMLEVFLGWQQGMCEHIVGR